jgi:hypothetical protein
MVGAPAPALSGTDQDGRPVEVAFERPTLLLFLTAGCQTCQGLWGELATVADVLVGVCRQVVVTASRSTEDRRRLRGLAGNLDVVMSSEAWFAYEARGAPWAVLVDEAGRLAAEGRPSSGADLVAMVGGHLNLGSPSADDG